jgi:prevent-host-death family protein
LLAVRVRSADVRFPARHVVQFADAVAISALRADLASWIERARGGEEVLVTDRGVPVARLLPVDSAPIIERLTREGVLSKPRQAPRPAATGRPRVRAHGPVAQLVNEQRD